MKTWDSDSPRAGRTAARKGAVTEELKKCRQEDWLGERKMDREGKERPIRSQGDQKVRRTPSGNPGSGQGKRHPGTASSDLRKNNTHREGAQRTASRSDGIQRTTPRRDSAQSAASQDDGIRRNASRKAGSHKKAHPGKTPDIREAKKARKREPRLTQYQR